MKAKDPYSSSVIGVFPRPEENMSEEKMKLDFAEFARVKEEWQKVKLEFEELGIRMCKLEDRMALSANVSADAHSIATKSMATSGQAMRLASETATAFGDVAASMKRHVDGNSVELRRLEGLVVSTRTEVQSIPANVKQELAPTAKEERNTRLRRWGLAIGIVAYGVFQALQILTKGGH